MLGEAVGGHGHVGTHVHVPVVAVVPQDALRGAVHKGDGRGAMRLDDAVTCMVIGVARDVAVVAKRLKPVFFVPLHDSQCVGHSVLDGDGVAIRVIGVELAACAAHGVGVIGGLVVICD